MKKLFLLFAVGSIAMNAGAQERIVPSNDEVVHDMPRRANGPSTAESHRNFTAAHTPSGSAHKTTAPPTGRWYDYTDYINLKAVFERGITGGSPDFIDVYNPFMWKDTFGIIGYTNGAAHNNLTSVGSILDPTFNGFNRGELFDAVYGAGNYLKVDPSSTYKWDSIFIGGFYTGPTTPTAVGIVDTLRIALFHDAPNSSDKATIFTGFSAPTTHYGTINFLTEQFDSIAITAITPKAPFPVYAGANPVTYMDVLFSSTDTSSFNITKTLPIVKGSGSKGSIGFGGAHGTIIDPATPISVGAGSVIGATFTYISGDPAARGTGTLTHLPGDTLVSFLASPNWRRNTFQPRIEFYTATDPTGLSTLPDPDFSPYLTYDQNEGLFNRQPYTPVSGKYQIYSPNWSWTSGGGTKAFYYQFPEVSYHVVCTACTAVTTAVNNVATVNSVSATPNPANNEVSINFSLVNAADVTVALTNMMGQVVASQHMNNTTNGKATFNVATLSAGVYAYTVTANGEKTTGRVVVAH